ncbi:hypothetical protein EJ069_23105 [Mesorhizobium sp. M2A.F.Ca.ET.043.05.1.1]|uniref:hypothetical protein n=1 Tax=Mesorhizobium sp. M2A.F.Ca.ET.043.05.1.1 TaxID=2493671 RepID=UPI000F7647EB|nr:hypothetical protein [Mesorhizobium sp. M2A.F.Ca.ET.043.05.1.1]AZO17352.1 hypothetical protein EJ069_23105 [Mesorhizobium sp. M2A.F.Ca.ET.043.05.1.1]
MIDARFASRWMLTFSLAALATLAIIAAYVYREQPAYTWDYGAYWRTFQDYGQYLAADPWPALKRIFDGIESQDYNPAGVLPLFPFYVLFGPGRIAYVSAVALMYLLPTAVIATAIFHRLAKNPVAELTSIFVMALTFVPFWAPTLRGMLDIVGLVFLGLATLLLFKSEYLRHRPVRNGLLLGLMIWLPFLFRRWYAYSIVIFFLAAFLVGTAKALYERAGTRAIANLCGGLAIAGIVLCGLAFALQHGLVVRAFTTSYADLYSAYQVPFPRHLEMLAERLSPWMIALIVIGAIVVVSHKNFEGGFCLLAAVGTFFFFIRTQYLGLHHFLPIAFWLLPIFLVGAAWCASYLQFLAARVRLLPFAAISSAILLVAISPASRSLDFPAHAFIPRADTSPLHLDNYAEYQRLVADLDHLTKDGSKFFVYASSSKISDSLMVALDHPLQGRVIYAPHIAKVDLFNFNALRAAYVVAVAPPQEQMAPGTQANITVPGQWLLQGRGFGRAYERVGTSYALSDGIEAYLFRRVRPVTLEEANELVTELDRHYPGWGKIFRSSMLLPLAARDETLGDQWGQVIVMGQNAFLIHPGTNLPTSVSVPFRSDISQHPKRLALSISNKLLQQCPTADGVEAHVTFNGRNIWSGEVLPGDDKRIDLPMEDGTLSLSVSDRSQPNCDHAVATFEF